MAVSESVKSLPERFKSQATLLVSIWILLFIIELVDKFLPGSEPLNQLGIRPRSLMGILGIPVAPLLHDGFIHLFENTVPFLILGWLVLLSGIRYFIQVSVAVIVFAGLGTWLFGAPGSVHVGLSSVIFGYFGYLLARGFYERKFSSMLIAAFVGIFYLGMLFQLVSLKAHISWSGHFFGFLGGIGTAWARYAKDPQLGSPNS
jgi:membrane associated rhomboid family serine protease